MIEVQGISKYYGSRRAIEDIHFSIDKGSIVGLLGLNGAGKSTILKILGCYLVPSSGHAAIGGYSINKDPHEVRKRIGFLPEVPPLYPEMEVESFLRFVAGLKSVPKRELDRHVNYAMECTNIIDMARIPLGALSQGYRQRVGIAQAIVHNPDVLILDEPITGLDPVQIVEMRDLITSLRGRHTVILSSHILSEITRTCDKILVIDQGSLVAEGSQEELSRNIAEKAVIELELRSSTEISGILDLIEEMEEVNSVTRKDGKNIEIVIDANSDIRSDLASLVVQKGGELLGLKRSGAGLESLFLKLINK